ncbi:GerAB/ArcD/ProY family transporter [Bacillus sp. 165]|uniref:GerAB/ArcD/ProY family transporter n=1 Tax=Bacillus sp. 165 TaxID=1529117 RepID=UPI001ADBA470|nr:GerAB/ArcD/ProY family transporter [Bacillus sp. 165]MBO9129842.1 GerAB/ArcD/ProY family transporter [Bacillus sp. 165]
MDVHKQHVLNAYHVIFLIQGAMTGIQLLSLSHDLSDVGYSMWVIPLLLGIIYQIILVYTIALCRQYPNDTILVINQKVLGNFLGKAMNILLFVYTSLIIVLTIRPYIIVVILYTISKENLRIWFLFFLLFNTIYLCKGGIKLIARFSTVSFFFSIMMLILIINVFFEGTWSHLLPLLNTTIKDTALGLHKGSPAFFGWELILFYFPSIIEKKKALKHASIGLWLTACVYFISLIANIIYFNTWQLQHNVFPYNSLLQSFHSSFIERLENIGTYVGMFLVLSTAATYLWAATTAFGNIVKKESHWHVYVVGGILFMFMCTPYSKTAHSYILAVVQYLAYGIYLLPLLLMLIRKVRV